MNFSLKFNRKNKFGRHLTNLIVPGWGSGYAKNGVPVTGEIRRFGRDPLVYTAEDVSTSNNSNLFMSIEHDHRGRPSKYIETYAAQNATGYRYKASPGDLGPFRSPNFMMVAIVKLYGNGSDGNNGGDPRIWTKDEGATEQDHDLMLGLVRNGQRTYPRLRIRINGTVETIIPDTAFQSNATINDGWHLLAVNCYYSGTNTLATVHMIGPDGRYIRAAGANPAGTYDPRNTTSEGMYATAADAFNSSSIGILGIWMFDGHTFDSAENTFGLAPTLFEFWKNPWQVFEPRRMFFHEHTYDPTATIEAPLEGETLTITLVDAAGTTLPNLTGLSWAWFDQNTPDTVVAPVNQGTGETTDGSGIFSVQLTNTTLTSGQTGALALMDSTGYIYAWYRITL